MKGFFGVNNSLSYTPKPSKPSTSWRQLLAPSHQPGTQPTASLQELQHSPRPLHCWTPPPERGRVGGRTSSNFEVEFERHIEKIHLIPNQKLHFFFFFAFSTIKNCGDILEEAEGWRYVGISIRISNRPTVQPNYHLCMSDFTGQARAGGSQLIHTSSKCLEFPKGFGVCKSQGQPRCGMVQKTL